MSAPTPAPGSDRLLGIRAKIERAKEHIGNLESRVRTFRETNPYRIGVEVDPQSGKRRYKVRVVASPPIDLGLLAGEAVHQLRSSLDHLAWQLVKANNGTPDPRTFFPIKDAAPVSTQDKKAFQAKIKGMDPGAKAIIERLQPYQSRDLDLWILHRLDNIDKHQVLFLVACDVKQIGVVLTPGTPDPQGGFIFIGRRSNPNARGKFMILEDGAELGAYVGAQPNMHENFHVAFEIAFGEPEIVEGEPVLPLLHQLVGLVDGIVNLFVPFL